ncbi:CinA family protein [Tianweitania populi]|uniref:Competence damage-inducible protein A n=1 Tax=Tianweitania populi TaxID=1607949 RepID=A0A8J3GKX3_9HYPH|nr:CinA family protein [Tianweitania populi]GHD09420.1 competence damage-inducible protein A [Tianweitania populi]
MSDDTDLVVEFLKGCWERRVMAATAESCTGGLIATMLTDVPGASAVIDRGFVTYSNASKVEMLGVTVETLEQFGAVSQQTALEMAAGALENSKAGIALATTGVAGPEGGTDDKPVGLVWFGIAVERRKPLAIKRVFENNGRDFIRREAARTALQYGVEALRGA